MIVHNLHVESVSIFPHEANTPLVIDADAVLPCAVPFQRVANASGWFQLMKSRSWMIGTHFLVAELLVWVFRVADSSRHWKGRGIDLRPGTEQTIQLSD
jgi:hypothetical protein